MSEGLFKMYVSFVAMVLMFIAVFGTIIAREKLTGIFQKIILSITFICMILAGFLIFLIVINVPTP